MRRAFPSALRTILPPLAVFIIGALFAEWLLRALNVQAFLLPRPSQVWRGTIDRHDELFGSLWTTAKAALIGFGALHVMWDDLGEIRTLVVADEWMHRGVGRGLVNGLEDQARALGLSRLFCLTFEVDFFTRRGFEEIGEQVVDPDVYSQLVRSPDEGIAEFLDLAHVKPNTLGNTRMLKRL